MVGLIEIAPLTETVEIERIGAKVTAGCLQASALGSLLWRFPELRKMWATGQWEVEQLLAMSDDVLNAVIAAGIQEIDEANAAHLALDEKAELLGAIQRMTMPRGPRPFVETLTRLLNVAGDATALAPNSLKQSKR